MTRPNLACIAAGALLLACLPVAAQQAPASAGAHAPQQAGIGDRVAEHARGRVAVNQVAGEGNAQANLAAIAAGRGGALTTAAVRQTVGAGDPRRDAHARIDGQAFAQTRGLLSVNQVAGGGNAQANLVLIGEGGGHAALVGLAQTVTGVADAALAGVAAASPVGVPSTPGAAPRREALIGSDAFARPQGLVQINQSAGVGNASANAIVLLLPGSGP